NFANDLQPTKESFPNEWSQGCVRAIHPRTAFKVDQRETGNEDHSKKDDQRPIHHAATVRNSIDSLRRVTGREGGCNSIRARAFDSEEHGQRHHSGSTLHHSAAAMRRIELQNHPSYRLPRWRRVPLKLNSTHHECLGHITDIQVSADRLLSTYCLHTQEAYRADSALQQGESAESFRAGFEVGICGARSRNK
ncbi:hypothetical protein, partial [Pseudomonas chlororaphis]|uniref:hypothetical protein n=1 Tax=Pseudomonas chlororaphis TaxID=587753 RepID=UPI001B323475